MKPNSLVVLACTIAMPALAPAFAQTWTPAQLAERTIERRAIEAVNWGMPAIMT